jgi:hypothetical protein
MEKVKNTKYSQRNLNNNDKLIVRGMESTNRYIDDL